MCVAVHSHVARIWLTVDSLHSLLIWGPMGGGFVVAGSVAGIEEENEIEVGGIERCDSASLRRY